jgi:hypothetical protein
MARLCHWRWLVSCMSSKQRTSLAALISASQKEGLGGYFLETLFVEIDSLDRYARTHPIVFGYHRLLSRRFLCAV